MSKQTPRDRGRPELPPEERKSVLLPVRMTEADKALIEAAAGGNTSKWARDTLVRVAKRSRK